MQTKWARRGDGSQRRTLQFVVCPDSERPCVLDEGGEQLLRKRSKMDKNASLDELGADCLLAAKLYDRGRFKTNDRVLRAIDHDAFVVVNPDREIVHRPAWGDGLAANCCNRRVGTAQQRSVAWAVAIDNVRSRWEACGNCFGVTDWAFGDVVNIAVGSELASEPTIADDAVPPPAPHADQRARKRPRRHAA